MITATSQLEEPAVIGARPISYPARLVDRVEETRLDGRRFLLFRAIVWTILAVLLVGGLLALADYLWILGQTIRQMNWLLAAVLAAALAVRRIVLNRRAALDRLDTAAEIETAFPDLGQRVCTTLEYAEPKPSTMPAWPSLVQALTTETEEKTCRLDFKQVIPWHRLRWPAWATAVLAALFVLAIALCPSARIAAMRLFLIPVHYTQLQVEPGNQSVKVGSDVKISATISGRPVKKAELLLRKAGSENPWTAVSLGPDDPPGAPLSGTLETSLKKCREDTEYRVTAGAVESETYRLTILHPLDLKKIEAAIDPPAYTKKKPTTVEEGDFQVIEGSAIRFRFELDRPAQTGLLRLFPSGKEAASAKALPPVPLTTQGKMLTGALANVTRDLEYEIQAEAADGTKLDPRRFHISVQPDRKPSIRFDKPPPALEALPTTEVTMRVSAKDDFGLSKVGIVFKIGEGPEETLLLEKDPQQPVSLTKLATLYLETHKLNIQDGIVYHAFVEDNYPSGPHRVDSDLQFIDIRAYKKEFVLGKADKGMSITLEQLISRQRTNLQHTFGQCGESKADDRIAKRLAKSERSLAKLTKKFSEELAEKVGWVPCLDKAVETMQSAVSELDKNRMKPACDKEELALALLIQARENLKQLLANPKTAAEMEQLDYQAQKNQPEHPKDEDEEEEPPEGNLQKQIEDLAKTEQETAEEIDGKSSDSSSNPQSPKINKKPSASESRDKKDKPSQNRGPSQGSEQPQKSEPSQGGGQSPSKSPAERQQQAAKKAAEIAKKMQEDDAMTELAHERMANAERTIQSSAKSLERGNPSNAGREAREAAAQLERLARQVAGLKAAELADKLNASESLARQLAKQQHDAENADGSEKDGKGEDGKEKGMEKGKGEGEGEGALQPGQLAERQRAEAEEARTLEDLLNESQKDASLADPDLVRALEEAAQANPPKEIVSQMDRAAKALSAGERKKAQREIGASAKRLEALADQLDAARRGFLEPKLDALMEAEKQASELEKKLSSPVADWERSQVDKKMTELRGTLNALNGKGDNFREETNALADAVQSVFSGRGAWRPSRQGYSEPPELYASSVERVVHALQKRIQEMILKDALLDQDQPVPEQYRKHVEEYFRVMSEDLR